MSTPPHRVRIAAYTIWAGGVIFVVLGLAMFLAGAEGLSWFGSRAVEILLGAISVIVGILLLRLMHATRQFA